MFVRWFGVDGFLGFDCLGTDLDCRGGLIEIFWVFLRLLVFFCLFVDYCWNICC